MTSITTRATVTFRLAEREAEIIGQAPASGHLLVAAIWEGGGIAATALAEAGLGKEHEARVRDLLTDTPADERGMTLSEAKEAALQVAIDLRHDYIGTEHQLLAIVADPKLSTIILPAEVRKQAEALARDMIHRASSR